MPYVLHIKKQGVNKDVQDCVDKELAFSSERACAKLLQVGKVSAVGSTEVLFDDIVSFPIELDVWLYDSVDSYYKPKDMEFDLNKIYLTGGEANGSYYYYFVWYA